MSYILLSDKHINTLVRAAVETSGSVFEFSINTGDEAIHYDNPNDVGQVLMDLNYYSIKCRYRENIQPKKYNYQDCDLLSPVEILKACDCYDYQCSNIGVYEATEAGCIINTIRKYFIQQLPGYDKAEWHIC